MSSKKQKNAITKFNKIINLIESDFYMNNARYLCEELILFLENNEHYLSEDDIQRADDLIQRVQGWVTFNELSE